MVKNPEILEKIELEYERKHPPTLERKFAIFEEIYQHVIKLRGADLDNTDDHL